MGWTRLLIRVGDRTREERAAKTACRAASRSRAPIHIKMLVKRRRGAAALCRTVLCAIAIVFGGLFTAAIELGPPVFEGVAHAQSTPQGLSKIEEKIGDVASLLEKVAVVFVVIGVLFVGIKFVQGDPHAWRLGMGVVVGAAVIFSASEIARWLQT